MKKYLKTFTLSLMCMSILSFLIPTAGAATLDVCRSGCTYATIQSAIDQAVNGDVVSVAADISPYQENINFGTKAITVLGAGAASTAIDGSKPINADFGSVVTFGLVTAASVIDGFTITGGSGTLVGLYRYGAGVYAPSGAPTIRNCIITGNVLNVNDYRSAGGGIYAQNATIANCTITHNDGRSAGGGIYGTYQPTVIGCVIADNDADWGSGLCLTRGGTLRDSIIRHNGWKMAGWGGGMELDGPTTVTNCLIAENQGGDGGGVRMYSSWSTFTNCTFANNSGGSISVLYGNLAVVNSVFWGGTWIGNYQNTATVNISYSDVEGGWTGEGNINLDPLFADSAAGDYRLRDGSPCIDAATAVGAPANDIQGVSRPQGAGFDMGAYERHDFDGDGYGDGSECDDNDPAVNPGAVEICDGIDNDCDGAIDENPITISATFGAGGSIAPPGVATLNCGGSQCYTITPNANYKIVDVKVDGVSVGAVSSYCFSNLTANHTISATFALYTAVTVIKPNGGEVLATGSSYAIKWGAPTTAVKFNLSYSTNNGSSYTTIANGVTGYSYTWSVPKLTANSAQCRVKVVGLDSRGRTVATDVSDTVFTIEVLRVTSPNGGEIWQRGTVHAITWITNALSQTLNKVTVSYSTNGGTAWTKITDLTTNPGTYNWTIPTTINSATCRVKVEIFRNNASLGMDTSNANFTIQP